LFSLLSRAIRITEYQAVAGKGGNKVNQRLCSRKSLATAWQTAGRFGDEDERPEVRRMRRKGG